MVAAQEQAQIININGQDFVPQEIAEKFKTSLEQRLERLEGAMDSLLAASVGVIAREELSANLIPTTNTNTPKKNKSLQQISTRKLPRIPKLVIKTWRKAEDMVSEFLAAYDPTGEYHVEMVQEVLQESELGLKYKKNLMLGYDIQKKPAQYQKRWEKIESALAAIASPKLWTTRICDRDCSDPYSDL